MSYVDVMKSYGKRDVGFIASTPTTRASIAHMSKLGMKQKHVRKINQKAMEWTLKFLRSSNLKAYAEEVCLAGNIGPRDEFYNQKTIMSVSEAYDYHKTQFD